MLRYALIFLIVAILAGALGMFNISALATRIAWILVVIFLVLFVISLITGKRNVS